MDTITSIRQALDEWIAVAPDRKRRSLKSLELNDVLRRADEIYKAATS